MEGILLAAALLLAFVNGANDNFKGVATLWGSGALSYRHSLALATLSTGLGSLLSLILARGLIHAFSGAGILPHDLLGPALLAPVAVAAVTTVLLATRLGFPVSTTHALLGGLLGAGAVAEGSALQVAGLTRTFLLPLLLSPLLAIAVTWAGLRAVRAASRRLGLKTRSCICLGSSLELAEVRCPVHGGVASVAALRLPFEMGGVGSELRVWVGEAPDCREEFEGPVAALSAGAPLYWGHLLSACAVGFARGLNDTPKILGLLVGFAWISLPEAAIAVALTMALGGLLAARRVAETLAKRITPMTESQGLAGNLTTSLLVIGASRFGLPVSTTHVAAGSIFGIGRAGRSLDRRTVGRLVAAWGITLPAAGCIAAALMWGQRWM